MVGAGSLIAVFFVPSLGSEYLAAIYHPLQMFKTPTLGSFLYEWTGQNHAFIRLIPTIVGGIIFLHWHLQHSSSYSLQQWVYIAIPWSLLLSPYGWHFDQMLLLPSMLWCLKECSNSHYVGGLWAAGIAIGMNLAVGMLGNTQQGTIWFTALWAIVTFLVARSKIRSQPEAGEQKPLRLSHGFLSPIP
jgi:hypothetical protein